MPAAPKPAEVAPAAPVQVEKASEQTPAPTKGKAKGRFFYGCNRYPECDYLTWSKPKKAVEPEGEALPVTEERDDG